MQLLFLIGLMGSGKSHWGRRLAAAADLPFIDLDTMIEAGEGRSIRTIFETDGEAHFRILETKYLQQLNADEKAVVALGGGTPCSETNWSLIQSKGRSVYLKVSPNTAARRLAASTENRPLLKDKSEAGIAAFLEKQLLARGPFYERAGITLEAEQIRGVEDLLPYLPA